MTVAKREMPEAKVRQLLTLNWTHCIRCWSRGERVRVVQPSRDNRVGTAAYRQARRRAAARHYRQAHPEVSFDGQ